MSVPRNRTGLRAGVGIVAGLFTASITVHARAAVVCTAEDFGCPAGGTCTINGTWDVRDAPECQLDFGDRNVVLKGTLRAEAAGGGIVISARDLTLDGGRLRAPGGADAWGGNIVVDVSGRFAMRGGGSQVLVDDAAQAGTIDILAGSVDIANGSISANGTRSNGDGGSVRVVGAGNVVVRGDVEVTGASPGGSGGTIEIASQEGRLELGGTLTAEGRGGFSVGGNVNLVAATDIVVDAHVNTSGGIEGTPGRVELVAGLDVEVVAGRTLRVHGGFVSATSPGGLVVRGTIDVSGRSGESGGSIDLEHCTITIPGTLDARAGAGFSAGSITLTGGALAVAAAGKVLATPCLEGPCTLFVVREGEPAIAPGATITPPAEVTVDEALSICCGNGLVDPGEECDDGGRLYCDGCTPLCTAEPVEPCPDDGNPCTGSCIPTLGCQQLDGAACASDGDPCTDDLCRGGACTHVSPCDGEDDSPCRSGSCTPDGCVFIDLPDGIPCRLDAGTASFCLSGACYDPCDDGDPCTLDVRIGGPFCWHVDVECPLSCDGRPDGTPCSDGDPCTTGICRSKTCVASPVVCQGCRGSFCAGILGCFPGTDCGDDGNPCTVGSCDAVLGTCRRVPLVGTSCPDDGDACTLDICEAGVCTHVASGCGDTTTTTTTSISNTTTTTEPPPDAITLIPTTALVLKDRHTPPADPDRRRVTFKSVTRGAAGAHRILVPPRGSAGDPTPEGGTGGGATLTFYNAAGSGEKIVVPLPASGWTADRRTPAPKSYRYTGVAGTAVSRVVLKGDLLRVKGGRAAWGYTLDEAAQGRVAIRLTLGEAVTWCAEAPARSSGRPPTTTAHDRVDRFVAQPRSPAPVVCPAMP